MGDDRVGKGAVPTGPGVGVQDFLSESVRYPAGDSTCIYEDTFVCEVGQQAAPVSDADRRVEGDRLPDLVDVGFCDAVLPQDRGGQIGALDLEASLPECVPATSSRLRA